MYMSIYLNLNQKLVEEELRTVSDSFGAKKIPGKAPSYNFKEILEWFEKIITSNTDKPLKELHKNINKIITKTDIKTKNYILKSTFRFSFLIELTNLKITSTKFKTRWHPCKIIKTKKDSFQNYEGNFDPQSDPRSNNFDKCIEIFVQTIKIIANSDDHLDIYKLMANKRLNSVSYESLIKYSSYENDKIHDIHNIELCDVEDIGWLLKVRPILRKVLKENAPDLLKKINTKTFKTDRSQTGEDQTNRAKRWECLGTDMQKGTVEQCWSVERVLFEQLFNFKNFPQIDVIKEKLIVHNINPFTDTTKCPITLIEFDFNDIKNDGSHGKSSFQVGHMTPLKNEGLHQGSNISWISDDGNRIQGSLSVQETRILLSKIMNNMKGANLFS